jgi:GntR family transcriptional regulator / MocR family aminotransferase
MFWPDIDRNSRTPLTRQIYEQFRKQILGGEITAGYRLPATRELAAVLVVSRNIIIEVYEMLMAEGYVNGCRGSGTYVSEGAFLPEAGETRRTNAVYKIKPESDVKNIIDFRSGLPALDLFPSGKWGSLFREICQSTCFTMLGYGNSAGCEELRQVLCRYLYKTRGVICSPENMIITTGAVQALQLATNLLLSPGDEMVLEDPSNRDLQKIFAYTGASVYPVPVDEQGLKTGMLPTDRDIKLVYVTPSHQYPLGGILPVQRRVELINFAREKSCFIIEDDYDSEFRYEGPPVSSLQGLDPEKVIYVGTFSKILFPALRIGYMVLPEKFVKTCSRLKRHSDYQTPILDQLTLARFINEGLLNRHVARMKKVYRKRRFKLVESLKTCFGDRCRIIGNSTGLHLVLDFDVEITWHLVNDLKKCGVRVYPVEHHSIVKGCHRSKLIMGYGHLNEEQIEEGVNKMKSCLF